MIAAHRRRHRRVLMLLAVALPLLLWLALEARPDWPRQSPLPAAVGTTADDAR